MLSFGLVEEWYAFLILLVISVKGLVWSFIVLAIWCSEWPMGAKPFCQPHLCWWNKRNKERKAANTSFGAQQKKKSLKVIRVKTPLELPKA